MRVCDRPPRSTLNLVTESGGSVLSDPFLRYCYRLSFVPFLGNMTAERCTTYMVRPAILICDFRTSQSFPPEIPVLPQASKGHV